MKRYSIVSLQNKKPPIWAVFYRVLLFRGIAQNTPYFLSKSASNPFLFNVYNHQFIGRIRRGSACNNSSPIFCAFNISSDVLCIATSIPTFLNFCSAIGNVVSVIYVNVPLQYAKSVSGGGQSILFVIVMRADGKYFTYFCYDSNF